ncbi:MAG TPA: class I SAM-dependent methyltransferase [Chitinophagaceae bacterium]|nr:class I SAM-dependent methyltransferase [Chitinophagaceae bacterium]
MNTNEVLTGLQRQYMDNDSFSKEREAIHNSWFNEDTTDFWRHKRMYETIRPLAAYYKDLQWLTIGDGRYGLDSVRMKKLFSLEHILPTDIAENMLKKSKEKGLVNDYRVENAEHLSFANNSFDVVFCKEAFHHFPRPYPALYEMIRVCRKAVVLIEPAERSELSGIKSGKYILSAFRLLLSKLFGRTYYPYIPETTKQGHAFEEAGNYLYSVSISEMEKLVHGMDLGGMAWFGFNDVYIKGCEFEQPISGSPLFEKINVEINKGNELCRKYPRFYQYNMSTVIIFKEQPDEELRQQLSQAGYHLPQKNKNPFV